jgi:signal transduction histidine kinase
LKEHCRDISTRTSLSIDYRGVELPELPEEISICLYRFVQEALTNVLRHAKASSVKVRLSYRKNMITLTVLDDGQGMNTTYYLEGIGLQGMRERLNLLGGRLVLRSSPGNGVRVSACVPWVGSMKKSIV